MLRKITPNFHRKEKHMLHEIGPKAVKSLSTVSSKLLIILIKAKFCIPFLQKETVFMQFKICVIKSRLADKRLNPRLFYRNVFGIFAG